MKQTALLLVLFLARLPTADANFFADFFEFLKNLFCLIPILELFFDCEDNEPITPVPTAAPTTPPTAPPTAPPTFGDACFPFPCGSNSFCVSEQGEFACFCEPGFSGDPLTGCTGLPYLSLTGVSPNYL